MTSNIEFYVEPNNKFRVRVEQRYLQTHFLANDVLQLKKWLNPERGRPSTQETDNHHEWEKRILRAMVKGALKVTAVF